MNFSDFKIGLQIEWTEGVIQIEWKVKSCSLELQQAASNWLPYLPGLYI
jgi:hypothetical protein